MRTIDIRGITNMELVRGGTSEWYWATDYVHGDLYEAEELFRQKNSVQSNRLYLIHYPDGMVYEPVLPVDGQYLGYPVFDGESVVLLVVNFTESAIHILRFLHQQEKTQEVVQIGRASCRERVSEVLTSARENAGSRTAAFVCGERLLQSDSSPLTAIADPAAK